MRLAYRKARWTVPRHTQQSVLAHPLTRAPPSPTPSVITRVVHRLRRRRRRLSSLCGGGRLERRERERAGGTHHGHEVEHGVGTLATHQVHHGLVAQEVTRHHGVVRVALHRVQRVKHRADAALPGRGTMPAVGGEYGARVSAHSASLASVLTSTPPLGVPRHCFGQLSQGSSTLSLSQCHGEPS